MTDPSDDPCSECGEPTGDYDSEGRCKVCSPNWTPPEPTPLQQGGRYRRF